VTSESAKTTGASLGEEGISEGKVEDMINKIITQIGAGKLVVLGNEGNGKINDIIVGNKNYMHKKDVNSEDAALALAQATNDAMAGGSISSQSGSGSASRSSASSGSSSLSGSGSTTASSSGSLNPPSASSGSAGSVSSGSR